MRADLSGASAGLSGECGEEGVGGHTHTRTDQKGEGIRSRFSEGKC